MSPDNATEDFFRLRLDVMIDLRTPLAVLASRMPWQQLEANVAYLFVRKAKAGKRMPDLDLFGQGVQDAPKRSNAGRPRVPLRTMMALLYLKHVFNESDEGVVARCAETPSWQYFCGHVYFEQRQPCDATTLVKFRKMLGDEGMEELLAQTVNAAVDMKLIAPAALATVIVDSTVQHKSIAHPTDSRLLETARAKLVEVAKDADIELKQTYAKEGTHLGYKAGRYAHARQFKRMRKVIGRQRTVLGRLMRDIQRKASTVGATAAMGNATAISTALRQRLDVAFAKAAQIIKQSAARKAKDGLAKLYAWHVPEVSCISKGKAKTPYEFGCKVGIVSTLAGNRIVGAKAFHHNPYDGHTLRAQLEQAGILMQDTGAAPTTAYVDLGYRGVDHDNEGVRGVGIVNGGKYKRLTPQERKLLKRRQAIEPIIGHLKQDHRMGRCHLAGELGDRLHAVLCAAGYNIKWLLRMIVVMGVAFLRVLLLRLRWAMAMGAAVLQCCKLMSRRYQQVLWYQRVAGHE